MIKKKEEEEEKNGGMQDLTFQTANIFLFSFLCFFSEHFSPLLAIYFHMITIIPFIFLEMSS